MLLSSLIGADATAPAGAGNVEIAGISSDSRQIRPGFVFAAIAGSKADGARFIADAIAKGAAAILVNDETEVVGHGDVPVLRATEPRRALALMAARFFGLRQPETTVAVTGTSGKTSVADFTRQIYAALGHKSASLGTIGVVKGDSAIYGSLTTPDPVSLHKTLAELAAEGITHLAFEASSHGLDQHRLDGVMLKAAAFTNLGRDHLDYHPTVEEYLAAKLRLFTELLPDDGVAVINADGAEAARAIEAAEASGRPVFTVGRAGTGLKLGRLVREGFAQRMSVAHEGRTFDIRLPLLGEYQASNALVAAGLAIATGDVPGRVLPALQGLKGVKGRLEIIGEARGGLAVVDYAHKPEALAAVLDALRPFATGKLICVMGCGGDRDKGKRPIMGAIAVEKSDVVIVTDDNPRTEKPEAIRAEIIAAAPGAQEIGDRAEAISAGVAMLGEGDVLVVAGKGHETGQIVGDRVLPFSDHDEVRKALERG
jgi:UDP-N-acetylmuramoyl-L-alanyl-D-glutamate--2,6-diaminopimelate ligase